MTFFLIEKIKYFYFAYSKLFKKLLIISHKNLKRQITESWWTWEKLSRGVMRDVDLVLCGGIAYYCQF